MARPGWSTNGAALAVGCFVSACAAVWGFEPGDPSGTGLGPAGGSAGQGAAGHGGSGSVGGAAGEGGATAGAGGTPFVQHQEGSIDVAWDFGGSTGFFNIDQYVCFEQLGGHSQWRSHWSWVDRTYGGDAAIESHGRRFDDSIGPTIVFSLAQATSARSGPCQAVEGEVPGYSCRIAYELAVGRCYRLRVWRLEADAEGQWWGCWIMDRDSLVESPVGELRVPLDAFTMGPSNNVVAYVGAAVECDAVPLAIALLGAPGANQNGAETYERDAVFATSSKAACTGGSVEATDLGWRPGVRVTLGGPL